MPCTGDFRPAFCLSSTGEFRLIVRLLYFYLFVRLLLVFLMILIWPRVGQVWIFFVWYSVCYVWSLFSSHGLFTLPLYNNWWFPFVRLHVKNCHILNKYTQWHINKTREHTLQLCSAKKPILHVQYFCSILHAISLNNRNHEQQNSDSLKTSNTCT